MKIFNFNYAFSFSASVVIGIFPFNIFLHTPHSTLLCHAERLNKVISTVWTMLLKKEHSGQ